MKTSIKALPRTAIPLRSTPANELRRWLLYYRKVEIKSYGHDRYGRTLAEMVFDNRNANIEMLKAGHIEEANPLMLERVSPR
jgi:endonuclease YncB( thermonuclease family)